MQSRVWFDDIESGAEKTYHQLNAKGQRNSRVLVTRILSEIQISIGEWCEIEQHWTSDSTSKAGLRPKQIQKPESTALVTISSIQARNRDASWN